jgi:hypothetical protein
MRYILSVMVLLSVVLFQGCFEKDNKDKNRTDLIILSPENNISVSYSYITLEAGGSHIEYMTAENRTLDNERNQTMLIKGVKNSDRFYF